MKIGYLIPEFPGQTHAFFMRESNVLAQLGIETDLVSTRPPVNGKAQHAWAGPAAERTTYLSPMRLSSLVSAWTEVLRSGPFGWARAAGTLVFAPDLSLKQRLKLAMFLPAAGMLRSIARRNGWSHIHVHSCANASNVAMLASLLGNLTYSMTLHGPLKDYGPNQKSKWKHSAFGVIITQELMEQANSELAGYLPKRIFLAPMGVEVSRFERTEEYVAASRKDVVRIVSCGRINPCKGHDDLIRAVAELKERGITAELQICGATDSTRVDYRDSLIQLAKELGVDDRFTLAGSLSEAEVRSRLEQAHVFCLASHKEPLGVATMEAMAMELPCVVTESPGVSEMIRHEHDGILVPPKSPESIADAVERILNDPVEAAAIGKRARQTITERFHSGVSAEAIRDGVSGRTSDRRVPVESMLAESTPVGVTA